MSLTPYKNDLPGTARSHELALPGKPGDPTAFLPKVEAGRFWNTLLRRGWIVLLAAILGGALMYQVAGKMNKFYRATGSVYVSSQAPQVLDIKSVTSEETRDLEQMRSVEQGLAASTLLLRVIEKHGLADDPTFAPSGLKPQALAKFFAGRVQVQLRRGTRIIDISVDDTDPQRAKRLVELIVKEYESWTTERQQQITKQASEGLAKEEQRLREKMNQSAAELQEFRESHPIPGLEGSESGSPVRDELSTLSSQLTTAKAERLKLEAGYEAISKFDSEDPRSLAGLESTERGTEVLSQLRNLQAKEADFSRLKERYLHKHPLYIEAANEIALLKEKLAETTRAAGDSIKQRYQVAMDNEKKLAHEVEQARELAVVTEGARQKFQTMQRAAEADRTLHAAVALRLSETTMSASVPTSVLRWEDYPLVPEFTKGPGRMIFAAVGTMAGFFGGLVLLIGLELADGKVRDSAAAAKAIGTPLLAAVPASNHAADSMVLLSDPSSPAAEAFRHLRTVLAPAPGGESGRTVLFSSARAGEGKSFCALNYAAALALQGYRTLLIDADLRHAGLSADRSRPDADSGLGGYLAGKIDPAQTCHPTSLANLYFIHSGPSRPDAAELLAGTRFPSLLEDAYRWFDRVVIDGSSVLTTSDVLSIARYADRCCLVVRSGGAQRRDLKRAAELTRSAGGNLFGFVWNESGHKSSDSAGHSAPVRVPIHSLPAGNSGGTNAPKLNVSRPAPPRYA
ncbi:MAG: polysaccharide biosynthesis tyrosine autokinase [Luteolibacter sp.]